MDTINKTMELNPYASKPKKTAQLNLRNQTESPYRMPVPAENTLYSFGKSHTPNLMVTQPYSVAVPFVDFDNTNSINKVSLHSDFILNHLSNDSPTMAFQGISFGYIHIINHYEHDKQEPFEVNIQGDDQEIAVELKPLPNNFIKINIIYYHKHLRSKWLVKHTPIKEQERSDRKRYKTAFALDDSDNADNNKQQKIHSEFITKLFAFHKSATCIPPTSFGYKQILNNYYHERTRPFDINIEDDYEELAIKVSASLNSIMKIDIVHFYKRKNPNWIVKYTNSTKIECNINDDDGDGKNNDK
jgi:hypothetical protein